MRMHRLPCASLLLALAGLAVPRAAAATQPTDFPSVRRFGPYFRIAGGAMVQTPRLLGPTGAIGWVHGREFVVHEVEEGSPAHGVLRPGDVVVKAQGRALGADPRMGLGYAVGQAEAADGKLRLTVYRDGTEQEAAVQLRRLGPYAATWPFGCEKSRRLHALFCDYLASVQNADGGFGFRTAGAANSLILLAHPDPKHLEHCRRFAYHCVRDQAGMGGLGTWPTGYTGIYLAEYYLVTGDRQVLPELERVCRILAEGQQACGSWGHGGTINRYYAVGGLVNQCGLGGWLAMVLAQQAGVTVDREALNRATAFFSSFADRGNVPYGDHRPWDGRTGNGKDALACIGLDLLGRKDESRLFADYITAYYPHRELGHTGPYFAILWGPVAALRTTDRADFHRLMNYWAWYYDLARSWEGGGLLLGTGGVYLKRGFRFCTAAVAMPYALPTGVERLAVMGAPTSVFAAGERSTIIAKARRLFFEQKWDELKTTLRAKKLAGDDVRYARQLLAAAEAAGRSVELTLEAVEANLDRGWDPGLAKRQLEDLQRFLVRDDPRVERLVRQVNEKGRLAAIEEAKKTYDRTVRLSRIDDGARKAMEQIAQNPKLGYLAELARRDLTEPRGFRAIFTLEADWGRFFGSWKKDPLSRKALVQIANTWGGNWPTREAIKHLRTAGHLLLDKETLDGWTELVPITDKEGTRGKPKTGRVRFAERGQAFQGPEGWHLPGFDDGEWAEGVFPVGTSHGSRSTTLIPKGKRACFARVRFRLDGTELASLRLLYRTRHLSNVYLNGHLVARILYEGNEGGYGTVYEALDLHPHASALLRKGENVLALEGAYDLWWGIFDVGLYGRKGDPPDVEPVAPPRSVRAVAPEAGDPRFAPRDAWQERQDAIETLPVAALIGKLADPHVHVRGHAARALAKKGKAATPALIKALAHEHWHVRRGACDAVRFMDKEARANAADALPALTQALGDGDFFVRDGAALAIAAIGQTPDEAVPALVKLLDDRDHWWPREAAVKALGGEARGLLPALVTTLHKTTNVCTESTLRQAIVRHARGEAADTVVEQTVGLLRKDDDALRQKILLELLKALKGKARGAAPAVEELLGKAGKDKKKRDYLQGVLKAIGAGR